MEGGLTFGGGSGNGSQVGGGGGGPGVHQNMGGQGGPGLELGGGRNSMGTPGGRSTMSNSVNESGEVG